MIFRSFLASPPYLAMLYFASLTAGMHVIPSVGELCDILAGYFAVSTLLGYNNYRGREGDAISPKADRRPLAGMAEAHAGAEVVVATTAFLTIFIPIARGNVVAAGLFAASLWIYVALFADRLSARPIPILKPLSATLGTALLMTGMLWPSLTLRPELATTAISTVLLTTVWRFAFELTCDTTDYEADISRGEVTPATSWGLRNVLILAPLSLVPCVVLIGALQLDARPDSAVAVLVACGSSFAVLAAGAISASRGTDLGVRLLVRFSTMFTFAAGLGLLLWNSGAHLAAMVWFVFMLVGADPSAVAKMLRSWLGRPVSSNTKIR
jgi:4-hydroxybenzoate polyprenyltransferase